MPIVMNVGPSAISAAGASGGGGQTLGNAQGSITINVHNVTQANKILQDSAKEMDKAFNNTGKAAQTASRVQIAESRAAAAQAASASKQKISADKTEISGIAVKTAQHTAATKQQIQNVRSSFAAQSTAAKLITVQNRQQAQSTIIANQVQMSSGRAAAAAAASNSRQQVAANRTQISGIGLAAAAHSAATKQQTQNTRLSVAQQVGAARALGATQRQQHQSVMQGIQQQIGANRLIVSGISAQNAAARQAAQQQKAAAQQSVSGWQRLSGQLNQVRTEILAIGAAAGLLTGFGIGAAATIQEARIQLKGMTGSLDEANVLMDALQKKGRAAGIPFKEMLLFSVQLLPILEGNTKELLKWFDIVRRTAVLNRQPGIGGVPGATFSLREAYLSVLQGGSDFVSLADRFNISKLALREAVEASGGDFLKAMDAVLTKMGITAQVADDMATSFNASMLVARDAVFQLAAEGFGPLIQVLGPVLQASADFIGVIRGGAPATLALGAGLAIVTVGGSALLLVVNQLTIAWTRMGLSAQVAIGRMAKIAAVAAVASLSVDAGTFFAEKSRASQGLPPLSEVTESKAAYAIFQLMGRALQALEAMSMALSAFQKAIWDTVSAVLRATATMNEGLAQILPTAGLRKHALESAASQRQTARDIDMGTFEERTSRVSGWEKIWDNFAKLGTSWGIKGLRGDTSGISSSRGEQESLDKRRDAILEWATKIEEIENDANRARLKSAIDYGRQVNEVNFKYQQNLTREAEDFAISRLRQEQQFNRQVMQAREESARQELKWREDLAKSIAEMTEDFVRTQGQQQEDHDEKIADIKKDSAEKLIELEEDYQKDRAKSLKDHRDKLLEAAANLDSAAVFAEQKRFAREQDEKEKDHKEKLAKEKENEQEKIDDENKSFEKRRKRDQEEFDRRLLREQESFEDRLEEAKEADERRLQDMRESLALQQKEEDEDRALRHARGAEDHARELVQMQLDHDEKMAEITRQEAREILSLQKKHEEELEKLGFFNRWKDEIENAFYTRSLKRHELYFKGWEEKEKALMEKTSAKPGPTYSEYQHGGFVRQTGLAKVHAGEYVINPNMTRALRDMLNGGFTQASMMTPTGGGRSRSSSVAFNGDISISIVGSTNMNERQMYSVARKAFTDSLKELVEQ